MNKIVRNILIGGLIGLGALIIMSKVSYNNSTQEENQKFLNVKSIEEINKLFKEEEVNREKGYSTIHWLDATEKDVNEQAEKMAKLVANDDNKDGDGIVDIYRASRIQDFYNSADDSSIIYALNEELKTLEYNEDIVKQYKCLYLINQVQGEIENEQANQIKNEGCTTLLDELGQNYVKNIATIKNAIEDNIAKIYKENK